MHESTTKYHSYLVRIWQDGEHALWHASAQCVQSQKVVHFADLEEIVPFLWAQTEPGQRSQDTHTPPDLGDVE